MRWVALCAAVVSLWSADPGMAVPSASAPVGAWQVEWLANGDRHRTWIVVGTAAGRLTPAWVTTDEMIDGEWKTSVGYLATAFVGEDGELHIDARQGLRAGQRAVVAGPRGANWYPDSFAIADDGSVRVCDENENHEMNQGTVIAQLDAQRDAEALRQRREATMAGATKLR